MIGDARLNQEARHDNGVGVGSVVALKIVTKTGFVLEPKRVVQPHGSLVAVVDAKVEFSKVAVASPLNQQFHHFSADSDVPKILEYRQAEFGVMAQSDLLR